MNKQKDCGAGARKRLGRSGPDAHANGRKEVVRKTGTARWEYRGRYLDRVSSDWMAEAEAIHRFTSLQLDTFHGLSKLRSPGAERTQTTPRPKKPRLLSRREDLIQHPIGTTVSRFHSVVDKQIDLVGQVRAFFLLLLAGFVPRRRLGIHDRLGNEERSEGKGSGRPVERVRRKMPVVAAVNFVYTIHMKQGLKSEVHKTPVGI